MNDRHRLTAPNHVNKDTVVYSQHMGGFYTGIACLVLFDARGPEGENYPHLLLGTLCVALLFLGLKYIPTIMHRPQQLMDAFCNDVLCIAAHVACISIVGDPRLRHGCALHSVCFILQQRFVGRMPSLATGTVVHTTLTLLLLGAYAYGPRISDVRQFMLSAVCPHALELVAQFLTHLHRLAVIWCSAAEGL